MLERARSELSEVTVATSWLWLPVTVFLLVAHFADVRPAWLAIALAAGGYALLQSRKVRVLLFRRRVAHVMLPVFGAALALGIAEWRHVFWRDVDTWGWAGGVGGAALSALLWNGKLSEPDPDADANHIRGVRLRHFGTVQEETAAATRVGEETFQFGPLAIPPPQAVNNFAVVGAPGSGKTLLQYMALKSLLPLITHGSCKRAFIYDAKTETVSRLRALGFRGELIITNFCDARAAGWELGADFTEPHTIAQLAQMLFPVTDHAHSNQQFFDHAVRDLATGMMLSWNARFPGAWSLRELINSMESEARLRQVLSWDLNANFSRLQLYFGPRDTLLNILATIASKVEPYRAIAAFWHAAPHRFSLTDWLTSESVLVLGRPMVAQTAADLFNSLLLERLTQLVVAAPNRDQAETYVFLDEVGKAGKLKNLDTLLLQGRSKGVRAWIGFQSIGSLRAAYGADLAGDILAGCGNIAVLALAEPDTAKWAEELWAKRVFWEKSLGYSASSGPHGGSHTSSTNWTVTVRPAVVASEFLALTPPSKRTRAPLAGFYRVPGAGSFGADITVDFLEKTLPDTGASTSDPRAPLDFVPAPRAHATLRRWSAAELHLLGLPAEDAALGAPPDDSDGGPPPRRPRPQRPSPSATTLDDVPNLFGKKKGR